MRTKKCHEFNSQKAEPRAVLLKAADKDNASPANTGASALFSRRAAAPRVFIASRGAGAHVGPGDPRDAICLPLLITSSRTCHLVTKRANNIVVCKETGVLDSVKTLC
ncbi:hypothetical protein ACJJTC_007752 [Scirpophaga incertulas]